MRTEKYIVYLLMGFASSMSLGSLKEQELDKRNNQNEEDYIQKNEENKETDGLSLFFLKCLFKDQIYPFKDVFDVIKKNSSRFKSDLEIFIEQFSDLENSIQAGVLTVLLVLDEIDLMEELLEKNPTIFDWRDDSIFGFSLIYCAILLDQVECIKIFTRYGADLINEEEDGYSYPVLAVRENKFSSVKYFLEQGANLWKKDKNGKTALDYLQAKKNSEINPEIVLLLQQEKESKKRSLPEITEESSDLSLDEESTSTD